MKLGQILMCCMTNISNMYLAECWRLETSSRLFYDFTKVIQQDLAIFNGWHIPFKITIIKLLLFIISINWPNLVTSWVLAEKEFSEIHLVSFTNTDRDLTDLLNHGMFKNTKTWISWERNIIFLRSKKSVLQMAHFEKLSFFSGGNL